MPKITVEICMGTTCFVMGASTLPDFLDLLSPAERSEVEVRHATCMGLCKDQKYGRAPYARVGDTVVSSASTLTLAEQVRKALRA